MKFSARHNIALAATLAISLAGKAASNRPVPLADQQFFAERLEGALQTASLKRFDRSDFADGIAVSAKNASCEVWATEYTPYGTMADVISSRAASVGELTYVYKGEVHYKPPKMEPLLAFYWWRELKRIGINAPRSPIVAIAASSSCDMSAVPWHEVSVVAR